MESTLAAVSRTGKGKNEARRLRASGHVPAVVYGAQKAGDSIAPVHIAVSPKDMMRILHSASGVNTLITLNGPGDSTQRVLVREFQLDPVTQVLLHADFYRVNLEKKIAVMVPIVLHGEPKGVKTQGGILEFLHKEVEVECLPTAIPDHIDVDVAELELGQADLRPRPRRRRFVDAAERGRPDARPHRQPEGGGGTGGRCGGDAGGGGRARSGQEGQDRQGRRRQGQAEEVKLIVGLGNPGARYDNTRHNIGFRVIDALARRWSVDQWREQHQALVARVREGDESVLVAKPVTFMNLSGEAVAGVAGFYKVAVPDVLVVLDEVALPLGRLRAGRGGSHGGHNGLKSVIARLGTSEVSRLRLGVGRGDGRKELADHVLGTFAVDERDEVEAAVLRAADAAVMFVTEGIERVMNAFNAANDKQDPGPVV